MHAMKGILIAAIAWSLLDLGIAFAQVGIAPVTPPLGMTSPLGIGPAAAVGTTGIPMGATELATPGVSPTAMSAATPGMMTSTSACSTGAASSSTAPTGAMNGESSATGAISGTSAPTALFDGAGIAGTASGTCASSTVTSSATGSASSPTMGARSSVGRLGVPLGSTELATGGLSPLPDITTQNQPAIISSGTVPCPTTDTSSATGMSSGSC
jgi:hypothetical protein